ARLRTGETPTPETLTRLATATAANRTNTTGCQYAKLHALALARLNRDAEAVEILRALRRNPLASPEIRNEAALLVGTILGPEKTESPGKAEGRESLLAVLAAKADPPLQLAALARLATVSSPPSPPAATAPASTALEIYEGLSTLARTSPDSRILNALHLTRAQIMFAAADYQRAERAANDLLELPVKTRAQEIAALRILANAAWQTGVPRRAADYLTQLAQRLPAGPTRYHAALAAADCYYLTATGTAGGTLPAPAAYAPAAATYAAIQNHLDTPAQRGNALYLRILCEIPGSPDPVTLTRILDAAANENDPHRAPDALNLLRAEWTYIEWLRTAKGIPQAALARLAYVLASNPKMKTQLPGVYIRFLWQKALIAYATNDTVTAAATASEIAATAHAFPPSIPDTIASQRDAILGKVALLQRRALIAARPETAREALAELRSKITDEEATIASYLVEGRILAASKSPAAAKKAFTDAWYHSTTKDIPGMEEYAAEALFSAALQDITLAKSGDHATTLVQALTALDNFARQYPAHKLATTARLLQADLFRDANSFGDAEAVYDALLARLPLNAADRWRAELGKADCLYARARAEDNRVAAERAVPASEYPAPSATANLLSLATNAYARLFALPTAPADLKAEAGYKWANTLASRYHAAAPTAALAPAPVAAEAAIAREADEVRWQVLAAVLKTPGTANALGANGRYWAARTLRELANSLKQRGQAAEAAKVWRLLLDYNRDLRDRPAHRLPMEDEATRELAALSTAPVAPKPAPKPTAPEVKPSPDINEIEPPPAPPDFVEPPPVPPAQETPTSAGTPPAAEAAAPTSTAPVAAPAP
ncbi:MAG: hypothetical protein LBV28_02315, partial [Puniceicoccales bacterium]|nr:hypothetical protein [Puniceicoccales bacterium]